MKSINFFQKSLLILLNIFKEYEAVDHRQKIVKLNSRSRKRPWGLILDVEEE
jgi:hypothetical protein